uniref:MYND-type domain-containing protein n=1 Tax=Caenorhabditis tropicalis TaxID=1561998 RepID=A0A1I7TJV9_9PELO
MSDDGEKQWTVVKKVIVENGKFREFRLPKSLSTDRSPLWRSKYEVGKRIGEVVKRKKAQIVELKRCISKIEQSQTKWLSLAKSVNQHNENFFLDALTGTDEDIEKFENENFFSNHSWAKDRDVAELTKEEMEEMGASSADEGTYDFDAELVNRGTKSEHYKWMREKTNRSSTSHNGNVDEIDIKTDECKIEKSVEVFETAEMSQVEKPESGEEELSTDVNQNLENGHSSIDQPENSPILSGDESEQQIQETQTVLDSDKLSETAETVEEEEKVKEEVPNLENPEIEPKELSESHSQPTTNDEKLEKTEDSTPVTESSSESCSLVNSQSPSVTETIETLDSSNSEPKTDIKPIVDNMEQPQSAETTCQNGDSKNSERDSTTTSSYSSTGPKKQLADISGITRLRLTSASSSPQVQPVEQVVPKKVHGNIWEQKAAEREEKLMDEKKTKDTDQNADIVTKPLNMNPSFNINKTANPIREPFQNGNSQKKPVKNIIKDTHASNNTNSWITFSSKNGNRQKNSNFLKNLERQESTSSSQKLTEKNGTCEEKAASSQASTPDSVSQKSESIEIPKPEKTTPEEKSAGSRIDEKEAEKRAKRRQRVQEKAKLCAKEHKNKEKEARRLKNMEKELRIQTEKQEKEAKQREEFEKKQKELEERRLKILGRPNKYDPESERINEMLESKERLAAHVLENSLFLRMISSTVYFEKRLPQIAEDLRLEINISKYNTLQKYKNRIDMVQEINTFLCFVSVQLMVENNDFKIEELLECMPNQGSDSESKQVDTVDSKYQDFRKNAKMTPIQIMLKATNFADLILRRLEKTNVDDPETKRTKEILKNYKKLYNEAVNFMGVTSYLHTRRKTEFFVVEEDYLLTVTESDNSGHLGENRRDNESDDERERVKVQDMSCQTEGDPYDVRAASYLPKED